MNDNTAAPSRTLIKTASAWLITLTLPGCGTAVESPRSAFQHDAAGKAAVTERRLQVSAGNDGPAFSLAAGSGVCNGYLFLADPRQSTVHHINLADGARIRAIGAGMTGTGSLKSPETTIPDCEGKVVYVVDSGGIVVFNMTNGEFIRRLPRASNAGAALGSGFLEDGFLFLPAIRFASMTDFGNSEIALRGSALGYRQHAAQEDDGRSLLELISERCRASSPCTRAAIDRIRQPEIQFLGCQGASHEVGVFNAEGRVVRRIDIRSPQFRDDGTTVSGTAPVARTIEWSQRNSSVIWCGAFGDLIATAHFTFEDGDWSPGVAMKPKVLLNIHRLDGTPVIADLALRDFPVAKDSDSIYVLAYGDARNSTDNRMLELERVQVLDKGSLNPQLIPIS